MGGHSRRQLLFLCPGGQSLSPPKPDSFQTRGRWGSSPPFSDLPLRLRWFKISIVTHSGLQSCSQLWRHTSVRLDGELSDGPCHLNKALIRWFKSEQIKWALLETVLLRASSISCLLTEEIPRWLSTILNYCTLPNSPHADNVNPTGQHIRPPISHFLLLWLCSFCYLS